MDLMEERGLTEPSVRCSRRRSDPEPIRSSARPDSHFNSLTALLSERSLPDSRMLSALKAGRNIRAVALGGISTLHRKESFSFFHELTIKP